MYLDTNNLYGWGMSQNLAVNDFQWIIKISKFYEDFIKNYDDNCNKGYIFKVDVEYTKNLFNLHSDLLFLDERNTIEKCNKLVSSLFKLVLCCSYKSFKRSIKSLFNTKNVHRVIQFK